MNVLFYFDVCKFECADVGKNSVGVSEDKYIRDVMLKPFKAPKSMLCVTAKVCSNHVINFGMIGYQYG